MVTLSHPSSHEWIARFCAKVLRLAPELSVTTAVRWAVSGFPYCGDIEPEAAAEMRVVATLMQRQERPSSYLRRLFHDDTRRAA